MDVKTYDPKQLVITFLGVPIVGYADGTFVKITRDEPMFTKVTGADGTPSRSKSNNRGGKVAITLQQTSPSNDVLAASAVADELRNAGVGPLLVKDINGTTVVFAANAWVEKQPDSEFGKVISDREWVIDCADMSLFVGGTL